MYFTTYGLRPGNLTGALSVELMAKPWEDRGNDDDDDLRQTTGAPPIGIGIGIGIVAPPSSPQVQQLGTRNDRLQDSLV